MDVRAPVAVALLLVLGAGLWWVVQQAPEPGASGDFAVFVVGPDGEAFANGSVSLRNATALSALLGLASLRGFDVGVESSAGFSGCSQQYVRSIGPYAETSTGGWNYYTREPGGHWSWQTAGAGCGLPAGVDVEWCWVGPDERCPHVA